jgi:uncharacterized protein YidB (DUF937 family)
MAGLDDLLGGLLGGGDDAGGSGGGGLSDILGGLTGGGGAASSTAAGGGNIGAMLLPLLAGLIANGGLSKLLGSLKANGLSSQADSWTGTGPNEAISADQVRAALGDDELAQIAGKLGVGKDEAAAAVAQVLPQVVDHVTPGGDVPADSDLKASFDRLVQSAGGR